MSMTWKHISDPESVLSEPAQMAPNNLTFQETDVLFKLFLLLNANDTVIFYETPENLQNDLDSMKKILW